MVAFLTRLDFTFVLFVFFSVGDSFLKNIAYHSESFRNHYQGKVYVHSTIPLPTLNITPLLQAVWLEKSTKHMYVFHFNSIIKF